jgi:uncharacterized repeat protein (TIGR01451 family)
MTSVRNKLKILALAGIALGLTAVALPAAATGTAAGTSITNRAVVSYSVGGVAQTVINSSPTGNSTPGVGLGADTAFVVDRLVNYTLTTVDTTAIVGTPGQTLLITTFLVTNTGNSTESYNAVAANLVGGTLFTTNTDTIDVANIKVYFGPDATTAYAPGTAIPATSAPDIPQDLGRRIYVLADLPVAATNGAGANVRLSVRAAVATSLGATLETATNAADTAGAVDVVISASAASISGSVTTSLKTADSGYAVQAPTLSVAKSEAVISDPVNGTTNPKAIPGATVEYTLSITNTGAVAANGVSFTDPVSTVLTLLQNTYSATSNVSITANGTTRFCVAEAGGDSNFDGCLFSGNTLTVNPTTPIVIPSGANNVATVKYRVTIN